MKLFISVLLSVLILFSCDKKDENSSLPGWYRFEGGPVFRDTLLNVAYNYEVASDAHIFFDDNSILRMIYTGEENEIVSIKLATGNSWSDWTKDKTLLSAPNSAGTDVYKETAFYRKSAAGKHQIFYIGYENETTYESQIFLAEADSFSGLYSQHSQPVVPKGLIAGKKVYCMTSPSILEHDGELYLVFIGWNAHPNEVTEVWIIGAKSADEGHTWTDYQLVETKIGMEGQVTKLPDGTFVAVSTGDFRDREAIYYATANHPFGPWTENGNPILIQEGAPYEKDEIIAAQITIDRETGKQYLYYTGADYQKGYWIMMATKI